MPSFQQKIMRHEETWKCDEYIGDKKQTIETAFDGAQMVDIGDKHFEIAL